jgi:hypothetical protein
MTRHLKQLKEIPGHKEEIVGNIKNETKQNRTTMTTETLPPLLRLLYTQIWDSRHGPYGLALSGSWSTSHSLGV